MYTIPSNVINRTPDYLLGVEGGQPVLVATPGTTPQWLPSGGGLLAPDGSVATLSNIVTEVQANASATTVVLTGAGVYWWYRCTTAAGNITVYDSLTASGKILVPTTALAAGVFPIGGAGNPNALQVANGVTVVLSGAATVFIGCSVA